MTNEGASVAAPPPASAPLVPSNICMHHNLCHSSEMDKTRIIMTSLCSTYKCLNYAIRRGKMQCIIVECTPSVQYDHSTYLCVPSVLSLRSEW